MRRRLVLSTVIVSLVVTWSIASVSSAHAAQSLHRYQTGKAVGGLQWQLGGHHPSVYKIRAYRRPITRVYDKYTATSVKNMKYRLGYPVKRLNGNVAGPQFQGFLKGHHRPFVYRKRAGDRLVAAQKRLHDLTNPPVNKQVATLVANANYLISRASLVRYSQTTRMQIVREKIHLPPLYRQIFEDCSSSVTGLYWLAGLPDPNGPRFNYNGYGYTGTLSTQGRVVWHLGQPLSLLRPGDLIFYGGGWPHHHVTMYIGNGRVFSHGTDTGPYNLPALYRSDAVGAHRYVTAG